MRNNILLISLAVAFAIGVALGILFSRSCSSPCPDISTDTTYISYIIPGDSVLIPVHVNVPMPVYIDTGSIIYIYVDVDTPAIIADYFRMKFYSDTIFQDSNFRVVIKDSINFNKIVWRGFEHQNLKATSLYTTQITHSDCNIPAWHLGIDGIFNSQRVYAGPAIMYRAKDYKYYKLGIHFAYNTSPAISFGYYKQINIKK